MAANSTAKQPKHRISFAKLREPLQAPNLLGLQVESFDWLLGNDAWKARVEAAQASGRNDVPDVSGLEEIFHEISPIEDVAGTMSLSFHDHRLESPKYSMEEAKAKDYTYSAPMYVTAEFMNYETGEIKSQTVFMGDFPLMTPAVPSSSTAPSVSSSPSSCVPRRVLREALGPLVGQGDLRREGHPLPWRMARVRDRQARRRRRAHRPQA